MNNTPRILASFPRTNGSEVRLMRKQYRGKVLVDLRLYWLNKSGEWQATRKGATLKPEELPELIRALSALVQEGGHHA